MNFIDLFFYWLMALAPTAPVETNTPVASTNAIQAPAAAQSVASSAGRVRVVEQEPARISNGF